MTDSEGQLLVSQDWLDRQSVSVLLVDARPATEYTAGHLPGAINLDTFFYVNEHTDATGLRVIARDWARMFAEAGITPADTVVFYDAGTENYAPRGAFMLRYLGHPASHVLHGGIAEWRAVGLPVTQEPTVRSAIPEGTYPIGGVPRRELIVTANELHAALNAANVVVLDVRTDGEYHGAMAMQGNPRLGHLPGVAHIEWTDLLDADKRAYRAPEAMRHILSAVGVAPDKEVIVYCQRSHRATNTYTALTHLGYPKVRVYVGSFYEWSRRDDLPIE